MRIEPADLEEAISLSDRVVVLSAGPATRPIGEYVIDLPRPRAPIVELLGEAYQNCPVLVVLHARPEHAALLRESDHTGQRYCTGADAITAYLHAAYGVSAAHP
mgnify:CR=1 FL=1